MKRVHLFFAFVLMLALVGVSPASAQQRSQRKDAAQGGVKMTIHTHSNNDPIFSNLLFPSDRLSYDFTEGEDFSYSSRLCSLSAPFNEVGLNFTPDYPGVDDDADSTAAVRHRVEGTITEVKGDKGTIEGKITTVLCQNGEETEHMIVTYYEAKFRRISDNVLQVTGRYRFSPTESTGTFAGLEGSGSIKGVLTCLAHQRNPSAPTCQQLGYYADFVAARGDLTKGPGELEPGLRGSYRDATVLTG